MVSWCVSANSGASRAARNARRAISGAVAGIDTNVTFSEIAGPEACAAVALATELKLDGALRLIEPLLETLLGELRRQTTAANGHALHRDINLRRIESRARISGGRKNASPVGIASGDRRLDQRRIGNRPGDPRCRVFGRSAGDLDGD